MHSTELMILFIMFLMLAVNSVFAAYEIALASLTTEKIRFLAERGMFKTESSGIPQIR